MSNPRLAGGEVFMVLRNSFEGYWQRRLTPVKITQSYPRVVDADCVVVRAFITVEARAFDALDAGDVHVNTPTMATNVVAS